MFCWLQRCHSCGATSTGVALCAAAVSATTSCSSITLRGFRQDFGGTTWCCGRWLVLGKRSKSLAQWTDCWRLTPRASSDLGALAAIPDDKRSPRVCCCFLHQRKRAGCHCRHAKVVPQRWDLRMTYLYKLNYEEFCWPLAGLATNEAAVCCARRAGPASRCHKGREQTKHQRKKMAPETH